MSRSGYSEDIDNIWEMIRWRGAVNSAIKGKRGQAFLREMAAALDAMPVKRLIFGKLISSNGEVCALGAVAKARGIKTSDIDSAADGINEMTANRFGISKALTAEIMHENDGDFYYATEDPEKKWIRMRKWVEENLQKI